MTDYARWQYNFDGYCKHIVAVLLAYQAQYKQLASRPGLNTLLAPLNCQRQAEKIMNATKSGEYHIAQTWLTFVKEVYLFHGQQQKWQQYLDNLLITHHRKRNLVPLLKAIR